MTALQKRCQELLPVIQAGAEGKSIEWHSTMEQRWYDAAHSTLCPHALRVKPEPQYRPFTHQELAGHIGNKVRDKSCKDNVYVVWGLTGSERVMFRESPIEVGGFRSLLELYEFTNGRPCGVLLME